MTVFKGFLTLVKRNLAMLFLHLVIFITLCITMQFMTSAGGGTFFQEESLEIGVIDKDGGILAEGLKEYLAETHVIVDMEDRKEVIQEKLFYRDVYYVVTIPEDFEENCLAGEEKLKTTKLPGAATTVYVDQQIDTFLNDVRILRAAGFSVEEAVGEVREIGKEESEVLLLDKNGYGGERASHAFMFQYMPYTIISVLCYVIGFIMVDYRQKEIRQRMQCSSVSLRRQNLQLVAAYLVIGAAFWGICMVLAIFMYGKGFLSDPNKIYYMINAFSMILVSLTISFVIGVIVETLEVINGVVNVLSLGMSFLCGVFVPVSLLSEGVRSVSRFLPVYWYEQVVEIIADNAVFSTEQFQKIWQCIGIQLLFAAAILSVGLVISKYKQQEQ